MEQVLKPLNILFDASGRQQLGSYRIPFIAVREAIAKREDCRIVRESDKVAPDVIFCLAGQGRVTTNKLKFPSAKIVLFKPHHENTLFLAPFKKPIQTILGIYSFLKDKQNRQKLKSDLLVTDYLVADSRKLKLHFEADGYKVHFMRLMETRTDCSQSPRTLVEHGESITLLFHGSATHYNSNLTFIKSVLAQLSQSRKVVFLCMMNQLGRLHDINIHNVEVKHYDYDYETLLELISKTDLGLVPNFIYPRNFLNRVLGHLLFFGSFQEKAEVILQKQSSNAGRAYLFANFGVPFLAHPTCEVLIDFSEIKGLAFPSNAVEAAYLGNRLIENKHLYIDISSQLLAFSEQYNLNTEVERLVCFLKNELDEIH